MSASLPVVFLDTSVLQHAADRRIVPMGFSRNIKWGGHAVPIKVVRWMETFPNDKKAAGLRRQINLLPFIAHLGRIARVDLLCHQEVLFELGGRGVRQDPRGRFYGAPVRMARNPIRYGRVIADGRKSGSEHRLAFLRSLKHSGYERLKKAASVQAGSKSELNQLTDAFHLWTAEASGSDFFLTTDKQLGRSIRAQPRYQPRIAVATPLELLQALDRRGYLRLRDLASYVVYHLKSRGRGPENHPLEQLRILSRALNRTEGIE